MGTVVKKRLAKGPCCDRSKASLDGSKVESSCSHWRRATADAAAPCHPRTNPRTKVEGPSSCKVGAGTPSQSSRQLGGVQSARLSSARVVAAGTARAEPEPQGHGGKLAPQAASADRGQASNPPKTPNKQRQKSEQQTPSQGHLATGQLGDPSSTKKVRKGGCSGGSSKRAATTKRLASHQARANAAGS